MRVTFLGTGSAMPTGDRFQTGQLLETDERALLLDCGSGVLHRLGRTEVGYTGIDTVLLTHLHLDHVADLLPLLKARWLAGAGSVSIVGPPGTDALLTGLLDTHEYLQGKLEFTVREITPGEHTVDGFELEAMETRHSLQCFAYRFHEGEGYTFSGDTEAFEALIDFADGSAVLTHDCSFPDSVDVSNHPTPSQLGGVLAGHDIGTVYLSHLYPHTEGEHQAMLDSIAEHYTGKVTFAADGESFEV
ncbi:MAG: MBL fold metallo-hydrolase [Halobacteriales archaeon]